MKNDDQDRFGMPDSAFAATHKTHGNAPIRRCGMYIPTRGEVASMAIADLRLILIDWLHESPTELGPD